jgi:hypothetical protein
MQAHHVISADGVKMSGLGKELEAFGYDINALDNLVFIPSTLKGACHLGVQPHRGNHTEEFDDDDAHPTTYHRYVAKQIMELSKYLRNECPGGDISKTKIINREMNKKGVDILSKIEKTPAALKLTKVAQHYTKNNMSGCGGVNNVGTHVGKPCPDERNHQGQDGIVFPKPKSFYKLTMGK